MADISEYVRAIKQTFSRWYNKVNNRSGYLWGDRFKSVLIEKGEVLLNCLAYIDLNPVRAGIVKRPVNIIYLTPSLCATDLHGFSLITVEREKVMCYNMCSGIIIKSDYKKDF